MIILSTIILAKTDSDLSFNTTKNCISSLLKSEEFNNNLELEIIIVESNKNYLEKYQFPDNVKVIIPNEDFGFHKFLNIGLRASKGGFIALCNNDLLFQKRWFSEILNVAENNPKIKSFSPIDNRNEKGKFKTPFEIGYKVQQQIKGWCLVLKRELVEKINYLDENSKFYYSDNDYALTLLYYGIQHAVVPKSYVQHLHKVTTTEKEKEDSFFIDISIDKKIPKYLYSQNFKWMLGNPRVLYDHLTYYNKWGSINSMYRVSKYAEKLNTLHLNFISKILFKVKMIFKL